MGDQQQKLRDRIQWLKGQIAACEEPARRESLILRLLDTDDELILLLCRPRARAVKRPAPVNREGSPTARAKLMRVTRTRL